jgi:hypothetical protein
MELRMQVDDAFIGKLRKALRNMPATDVVREALTLFHWAVEERTKGRVILSADDKGHNVTRLAMPSLESLEPVAATSHGRAATA